MQLLYDAQASPWVWILARRMPNLPKCVRNVISLSLGLQEKVISQMGIKHEAQWLIITCHSGVMMSLQPLKELNLQSIGFRFELRRLPVVAIKGFDALKLLVFEHQFVTARQAASLRKYRCVHGTLSMSNILKFKFMRPTRKCGSPRRT